MVHIASATIFYLICYRQENVSIFIDDLVGIFIPLTQIGQKSGKSQCWAILRWPYWIGTLQETRHL